ncbi:MAG: acyl-[acyl-carrier-protein]--UDP-N-acetylglucosamine O-acyltransferase, partial [Chroococcidiopsidaceae cyanobacterium CP_BM_RX_35]|nr:acyl-[acyl-carrier-protein]--UDP-N-acetylglucosamine O-acyltransferase [Chroococcidiopsidaceae cyanobacterium CP_BM_RX_35]
ILAYVHVAHDCVIEDEVVISNSTALGGHVHVESRATIGGMVGIHQFVHVGRLAMLSAMSRIDRDVPPYMLVEGHPARVRQLNLVGLRRAGIAEVDQGQGLHTLKEAFRLLYRSDLPLIQALEKLELLPENQHLQHLHRFLQLSHQLKGKGRRGPTPGKKSKDEE